MPLPFHLPRNLTTLHLTATLGFRKAPFSRDWGKAGLQDFTVSLLAKSNRGGGGREMLLSVGLTSRSTITGRIFRTSGAAPDCPFRWSTPPSPWHPAPPGPPPLTPPVHVHESHLRCAVRYSRSRKRRAPEASGGRAAAPTPHARWAARRAGRMAGTRAAAAAGRARRRGDQRRQYPGRGARSAAAGTFWQRRRRRTRADSKYNSRLEGQLLLAAPPRSGTAAGSPAVRPGSASAPPPCRPEGTVGRTLPSAGGLRCSLPGRLGIWFLNLFSSLNLQELKFRNPEMRSQVGLRKHHYEQS